MPDENKFKVLRALDYTIPPHCGICMSGSFMSPQSQWGKCLSFSYTHLKTGNIDGVSVIRSGRCPAFQLCVEDAADIGAHTEFLEK
jgi:hypothetical protein